MEGGMQKKMSQEPQARPKDASKPGGDREHAPREGNGETRRWSH